jgi:hypothetical protein
MKAALIKDFSIAPEGHTVFHYKTGDHVTGKIAELAIADNSAIEISDIALLEKKIETLTETKPRRIKSNANWKDKT